MCWSEKRKNALFSSNIGWKDFLMLLLLIPLIFMVCKFKMPLEEVFHTKAEITLGYSAKQGMDGNLYVLDDGHERLLCFDQEKNILFTIANPSDEKDSSLYIDDFCVTSKGIYLSATQWYEMEIEREVILLYDLQGNYEKKITERVYSDVYTNKHRFFGICEKNGSPFYAECYSDSILTEEQEIFYANAFNAVSDICFFEEDMYVLDKNGTINAFENGDTTGRLIYDISEEIDKNVTPYKITVDQNGNIYFTDIRNRQIRLVDMYEKNSDIICTDTDSLTVNLTDGGELLLLEEDGLHVAGEEDVVYLELQKNSRLIVFQIMWCLLLCLTCVLSAMLFVRILYLLQKKKFSTIQIVSFWVIGTVTIISVLLCGILLNVFVENYKEKIEEQVKSAAYMISSQLTGNDIAQIEETGGFDGEAYEHLCNVMENAFSVDVDLYRKLYCNILKLSEDGKEGYAVAYLDQSVGSYFPLNETEQEELKEVYETGEVVWNQEVNDISGTYLSVKVPVYDEYGNVCGAVAVGVETYVITDTVRQMLTKILVPVIILMIFVWMIAVEVITFANNFSIYKRHVEMGKEAVLPGHLFRVLLIFVFAAYNMTATFLPVYLMKRTDGFPEEFRELIGALPITLNMLIIGVMSLFCAKLMKRYGIKRIMVVSVLCSFAGNLCIFLFSGFLLITLGLIFDGIGVGLITNSVYVMLTYVKDEADRTWGLSIYNGVCFSGINFGMLLGSILAVTIGQKNVFLIVAIIWFLMVLLVRYMVDKLAGMVGTMEGEVNEKKKQGMSVGEFVFHNKPVFSFMLLIQNPYIIFGSFVFYYVPIYCNDQGYSEAVCSILVMLYLQVAVIGSHKLTEWFSALYGRYAMYIALGMNVVALLIFVLLHNIVGLVIALLILGFSASYGKPVQQNYYLDLEEVKQYGEDNAIGIYNFTENIGESLGPIVFGRLMTGARLKGKIGIFCSIITGMLCLHYFTCRKEFRNEKRREEI